MSKFKIGDKVFLVHPDIAEKHYALPEEFPVIGVVESVQEDEDWCSVKIKSSEFFWPEDALKKVEDSPLYQDYLEHLRLKAIFE